MKSRFHVSRHAIFRMGGLALLSAAALAPSALYAQGTTATLGGTVTDATGAVVPNAQIVLVNEASGDKRVSKSNGSGVFSFSGVPTGDYDVNIAAPGFAGFEQKSIHLDPGDQRTIRDINLSVGSATASIEVKSAADTINLDSGEQSALISAEDIKHLSVEGRDVTELLKILPGFAISKGGTGNIDNTAYDPAQVNPTGALGQYAANGTPVNGQALLSDGVDITDPGAFGGALQNVNYEQVAEVKVQTSSFTADTAHGPIVINAVGKSGGDKYHGSLYTFARTTSLNSTDWIAKYTGQAAPPDRYVYPGFTFGGPILIPGTGFNRNRRLTFFAGAEDYAQRNVYAYGSASAATLTALVPTAGMRTGDFSAAQLQQYLGPAYTIANGQSAALPVGGPCTIAGGGTPPDQNICRVPQTAPNGTALVNGNVGAYLDPLSKLILNGMPLPNTTSNGTYNWITTNLINNNLWQARGRVDDSFSDKDHIFGSYSIEKGAQGVPQNEYYSARGNLGGIDVPGGGLVSTLSSHVGSLNYNHTFGASLNNEFYAAGAYFSQDFVPKNLAATAGNPYEGVFNNGSHVQPTLEDYGNDGLPLLRTPDGTYGGIFAKKQVRIAGDNLTKTFGQHTVRAGVFYQWDNNPQVAPFINTNGTINQYYEGETFTDPVAGAIHNTGPVGSGNGGNYLADFAEGHVFGYNQTNIQPEPNLYFWNLAGYAQDHWRITSHLTLDGGVRFEHMTPWEDTHGAGVGVFTPAAYTAGINANVLPGIQWHAINKAIPNGGRPTRWGFIEPRVGFAWDPYSKGETIVRGGFGIYRAHDAYNDADNQAQTTLGLRTFTVNGPIQLSSISSFQPQASIPGQFANDSSAYAFDPKDDEEPRVRTYNLAVDQRLPGHMLLEVAYVGNVSDKLLNDGSTQNTTLDDLNSLPIGSLYQPQTGSRPDVLCSAGQTLANGCVTVGELHPLFAAAVPVGGSAPANNNVNGLSQGVIDSYKKFPRYNHIYVPEHNTYSNYNALQIGLTRQQGHGTFSTNYTFSKALGVLGIGGSATYSYPGDPFNYRNDYSNMPFDRRHIFNAAFAYQLGDPIKNRLIGEATNGWEVSGITNYQSGPNLQSIISPNFSPTGNVVVPVGTTGGVGANQSACPAPAVAPTNGQPATCTIAVSNTEILGTPDVDLQPALVGNPRAYSGNQQHINPAAFALPGIGTNGPYKYGFLPGPGFFDFDMTAAKRFRITEGSGIQLRVAAFNVINHANNSFTAVNTAGTTMMFNQTYTAVNSASGALNATGVSNNSGANEIGATPLKEGRRIMELGLRYDF